MPPILVRPRSRPCKAATQGQSVVREVVVTHALRTPIGRFLGASSTFRPRTWNVRGRDLLSARIDPRVDELVFGNGRQAGGGPNVARQVSVRAGIPESVPAYTVNMACGSGLKSLNLAAEAIRAGRADVIVAGGTESMSGLPFFLPKMRTGYRLGHAPVVDAMYRAGSVPARGHGMGETAEKLAKDLSIPRAEQDRFALESQRKAKAAIEAGRFADEISPVKIAGKKGETLVDRDEHPRFDTTPESLAKLPPVFDAKTGTVSAGNSSGITDGAAALLVMAADVASSLGYEPLATIGASTQAGVDRCHGDRARARDPEARGRDGRAARLRPRRAERAFAAQVLACHRELDFAMDRLNVNGGAIALGHPIGATGARIVVTLLHEMKKRKSRRGLATLCISGGMGIATEFTRG